MNWIYNKSDLWFPPQYLSKLPLSFRGKRVLSWVGEGRRCWAEGAEVTLYTTTYGSLLARSLRLSPMWYLDYSCDPALTRSTIYWKPSSDSSCGWTKPHMSHPSCHLGNLSHKTLTLTLPPPTHKYLANYLCKANKHEACFKQRECQRMRETTDKPYPQRGMMELGRERGELIYKL